MHRLAAGQPATLTRTFATTFIATLAGTLAGFGAAAAQSDRTVVDNLTVETIARGLERPWGLAFLPDGRMLVTERPGRMRLVGKDGKLSQPLAGVPKVFATGQGGLLDVVTDRGFAQNRTIYFCYAEPGDGGGRTSLARATLAEDGQKLDGVKVIFQQKGSLSQRNHWGCRIAQTADSNIFLTLGDHFTQRDEAQNLANHIGKIVRIKPDGSVPPDNPFVNRKGALPEIWSYGHRNSQGATLHPTTGAMWMHEHGARGGDEINVPEAGKNYGWPVITYGVDYSGAKIGVGTKRDGMEQPRHYWDPSIAPSGMAFYTGDLFPAWKGNLFIGGLTSKAVSRLELDGMKVTKEEQLLGSLDERIRDVRMGPDGALWLLTDTTNQSRILRVTPAK